MVLPFSWLPVIHEHTIRLRVAFSDTDMAGIVHFSNYFRYMEAAEHDFFRKLGYSIVTRIGDREYGWPRVHVECRFSHPLRFEDEFEIRLVVEDLSRRSIRYVFEFTKLAPEGEKIRLGQGSIVAVCVEHDPVSRGLRSVEIPHEIASLIRRTSREPHLNAGS